MRNIALQVFVAVTIAVVTGSVTYALTIQGAVNPVLVRIESMNKDVEHLGQRLNEQVKQEADDIAAAQRGDEFTRQDVSARFVGMANQMAEHTKQSSELIKLVTESNRKLNEFILLMMDRQQRSRIVDLGTNRTARSW